jgi:hypothetical protein
MKTAIYAPVAGRRTKGFFMIDGIFAVSPAGICGMNDLAIFLNKLQRTNAIADWHPMRAVSGSKSASYVVQFDTDHDASLAIERWAASAKAASALAAS